MAHNKHEITYEFYHNTTNLEELGYTHDKSKSYNRLKVSKKRKIEDEDEEKPSRLRDIPPEAEV